MNVRQLITQLQKMPADLEVRFALPKGKGNRRTLHPVNEIENYQDLMILLQFKEQ